MTAAALRALPALDENAFSWPDALLGALRPEFQTDIYFPKPGDPVLYGPTCAVQGCPGRGVNRSLGLKAKGKNHSIGTRFRGYVCLAHVAMWRRDGQPPIDAWIRHAARLHRGQGQLKRCGADKCPRSACRAGFCSAHEHRYIRAGRPSDIAAFARDVPAVAVGEQECRLDGCAFPSVGAEGLCDAHIQRLRNLRARRPDLSVGGFLEHVAALGQVKPQSFDMRDLPETARLELAYALQCRQQAGKARIDPLIFGRVVRWISELGVGSILERSEAFWTRSGDERFGKDRNPIGWLRYARRRNNELREQKAGTDLWSLDTWCVEQLDIDGRYAHQTHKRIYFVEIDPPWLRELVKRWARWRLMIQTKSPASIGCSTSSIRCFCRYCEQEGIDLSSDSQITRPLLERYLVHVRGLDRSVSRRGSLITDLKVFLDDVRLHDWAPGLPANATYYKGEPPRPRNHLPRFVDEHVMAQIEDPANLDRLPDLTTQTAIVILTETGLRSVDALRLKFDPITTDQAGAPYLRFYNHKLRRDAIIPISDRLVAQIRRQQADLDDRHGKPRPPYLLPALKSNADGTKPMTWGSLSGRLTRWIAACDMRDATGEPAKVTPHQFRHTVGTRMVNHDVSITAVQRMLDHDSPEMTARYARIKDATLRRHFEAYQQRINIRGDLIHLDPDGPLSDAAWAKENLARAKQTLPNGYCGLPLQQTCPHPNACLTCDSFLTTTEFLPQHREQLDRTNELIAAARDSGAQRLVDMNEPVRLSLLRIIEGLEALPGPDPADG